MFMFLHSTQITDRMKASLSTALQLSARPDSHPLYMLRLYPLSLERSALLAQCESEERRGRNIVEVAYEEEIRRVEEECAAGKVRVREMLLEGLEERRKKAREEKEGEGTSGGMRSCSCTSKFVAFYPYITDGSLDSQSRPHVTRKLRNKLGTSPPPTPAAGGVSTNNGIAAPAAHGHSNNGSMTPATLVPHSSTLSVDDIPSPFPLPLTSSTPQPFNHYKYTCVFEPFFQPLEEKGNKRGNKGKAPGHRLLGMHGLGPSVRLFHSPEVGSDQKPTDRAIARDEEVEHDLMEMRRGTKRKRNAVHAY